MKIEVNTHYKDLQESYLFSEIGRRVRAYADAHPDKKIIRLGIGDVTLPLSAPVTRAMQKACAEQADASSFHGYAPENGYAFLREAIARHYASFGVTLSLDEIFVSDGAKSDIANLTDLLGDNRIYIPDPVYPVYLDSNIMCGRRITFMPAHEENGFLPMPASDYTTGVFYLCSPNNPTGAVYSRSQLKEWVDFANRTGSLLLFDAAYEAFISGDYPHSIFEIDGARTCAIEICSFSKTAGFTGTRCSYTVVPDLLVADGLSLNHMWYRRQSTKFNGVSYVVQRGAEAALSPEGFAACLENISYYMGNARRIKELLLAKGIRFTGGDNAPYIWLRCPGGRNSWEFFDYLLEELQIVGTPGAGFGSCGEGYFRLTAFGSRENTEEAVRRLREKL